MKKGLKKSRLEEDVTMKRFQVVTMDSWKVIASGFHSYEEAENWAEAHDYGQFELDGGWLIWPYEEE